MSEIKNDYCYKCVKIKVCEWNKKIEALSGTEKKPILLNVTINECEEYIPVDKEED